MVVMANNNPQAAIISLEMLARYNRLVEEQELWSAIDQIRAKNADKNEDEVMKDITEAVEDVRQKMYEKTFGRS